MEYKGTVNKIGRSGDYGWISRKQVFRMNGEVFKIDGRKDIYVHQDDCEGKLAVGADVTFILGRDDARPDGLRAYGVKQFVPENHLELHIDARAIDNPSIPLRWCFTPEMYQRMVEGTKKGHSYAMLLVARHQDDRSGYREIRAIKSHKNPFSYLTLSRAGKWDVGMILFERTEFVPDRNNEADMERKVAEQFLDQRRDGHHSRYCLQLPRLQTNGFPVDEVLRRVPQGWQQVIAATEITVEIPEGIFAPPPSESKKAFANRFYKTAPYDECELRQRLMVMTLGFGWVPWLVIETVIRTLHLLAALVQLLFAFRGSWSNVVWSLTPSVCMVERLDLPQWGDDDKQLGQACYGPWNSKIGFFLTPGFLVLYAAVLWLLSWLVRGVYWLLSNYGEVVGLATAGIVAALFLIWAHDKMSRERKFKQQHNFDEQKIAEMRRAEEVLKRKRQAALLAAERDAVNLEQIAPALVCGVGTTHEIALRAIPAELKTFRMRFDHLKRQVCRPFGS